MLGSFDVDNINLETLMWQTGYLTIESSKETIRGQIYKLAIPNLEVQVSLMSHIADYIAKNQYAAIQKEKLYEALCKKDIKAVSYTHLTLPTKRIV